MADTLSASIGAGVSWLYADTLDLSTVSDNANLEYEFDFADGTGNNQADKVFHDERTVAASDEDDLDLAGGLSQTIFGSSVTYTFAKIKAILIRNMNTTSGDDINLDSSVTNSILTLFSSSATSKIPIPANGVLLMTNPIGGWAVTASTADILRIANGGSNSVTYRIVIVGTSA